MTTQVFQITILALLAGVYWMLAWIISEIRGCKEITRIIRRLDREAQVDMNYGDFPDWEGLWGKLMKYVDRGEE